MYVYSYGILDLIGLGGGGSSGEESGEDGSDDADEEASCSDYGWFRPEEHPYAVGRPKTFVAVGRGLGLVFDDYVPAGHTFGTLHDAYVGRATAGGAPDWAFNIPSMPGYYVTAVSFEFTNSINNLLNETLGTNYEILFRHSHDADSSDSCGDNGSD